MSLKNGPRRIAREEDACLSSRQHEPAPEARFDRMFAQEMPSGGVAVIGSFGVRLLPPVKPSTPNA
jgi:hypothetical protein